MNVDRDGQVDLAVVKSVTSTAGIELLGGDVLFNNTNSAELVGKTAVMSPRERGFAFSNHMTRIRLESGVSPDFIARQLHFLWMAGYMKHRCTNHVNQASISSKVLANGIPVLLPPAAEQTRIVEKLEELLSDLDAGVAELKAAQKKLAQYRQALLKAAVEGALTAEWRAVQTGEPETGAQLLARILTERRRRWEEKQLAKFRQQGKTPLMGWQAKYPEPVPPDTTDLPVLPEGWVWVAMDSLIADGPQNGLYLHAKHYGRGHPILRIDDFQVDWLRPRDDLNLVDATPETLATYALRCGDLLINRVNSMAHLGKSLVVGESLCDVLFESNMMRAQLSAVVDSSYVGLYLGAEIGRKRLICQAKWAVNQASINQQDVKRTPIPVPPMDEQRMIVEMVSSLLAAAEAQTKANEHALTQSAAQRKNLLKAAFSGQLVPQDPDDEPAGVLLERIRAERAGRVATGKPRGRKAKEPA